MQQQDDITPRGMRETLTREYPEQMPRIDLGLELYSIRKREQELLLELSTLATPPTKGLAHKDGHWKSKHGNTPPKSTYRFLKAVWTLEGVIDSLPYGSAPRWSSSPIRGKVRLDDLY